jgi:acyl carrier protein
VDSDALLAEIQNVFRDVFDEPDLTVTRESNAQTVEDWDSLTHVDLITSVEKRYKVKFALGELHTFKNVGDLLRALELKLASKH